MQSFIRDEDEVEFDTLIHADSFRIVGPGAFHAARGENDGKMFFSGDLLLSDDDDDDDDDASCDIAVRLLSVGVAGEDSTPIICDASCKNGKPLLGGLLICTVGKVISVTPQHQVLELHSRGLHFTCHFRDEGAKAAQVGSIIHVRGHLLGRVSSTTSPTLYPTHLIVGVCKSQICDAQSVHVGKYVKAPDVYTDLHSLRSGVSGYLRRMYAAAQYYFLESPQKDKPE